MKHLVFDNYILLQTPLYHHVLFADFTSVNSFQEDMKFSSPSFYNLTPPLPPASRPPAYDVQSNGVATAVPNGVVPSENYYAATDIVKVCEKIF